MCLTIQNYLVSCKKKTNQPTKAAGTEGMVLLIWFETPQFDTIYVVIIQNCLLFTNIY